MIRSSWVPLLSLFLRFARWMEVQEGSPSFGPREGGDLMPQDELLDIDLLDLDEEFDKEFGAPDLYG